MGLMAHTRVLISRIYIGMILQELGCGTLLIFPQKHPQHQEETREPRQVLTRHLTDRLA